ncbi:MAG TPA: hypothetical protein VF230_01550, partial [Acidimicrobiales bacterium]
MSKRRWWLAALMLAVLTLVAGACGSDDDPSVESGDDTGSGSASGTGAGEEEDEGPPEFAAGTTMKALQDKGKIVVGTK